MKKILLVEDDSMTSESYLDQLAEEDFEIVFVRTGEEALQELTSFRPDLVLLDIMLAGKMNGFDVLKQMRQDANLAQMPVIVMTNLDDQEKTAKEYQAVACYVKAQTNFETIRQKIYEVLKIQEEGQNKAQSVSESAH